MLAIIEGNPAKVDGIKISLLDKDKEIVTAPPPAGRRAHVYGRRFQLSRVDCRATIRVTPTPFWASSIRWPRRPAHAVSLLGQGDVVGFRATLDPTVPLARLIFRAPTQYYKTGVVFPGLAERISGSFRDAGRRAIDAALALFHRGVPPCRWLRFAARPGHGHIADEAPFGDLWRHLMRDFSTDHSALALNTATLGHNLEGYGAGWSPEQVIDACAERGYAGIVFWRREIGDRAVEIGDRVRAAGMEVTGLCRTPYLTGSEAPASLDEARASVDMAAALGTKVLTIVTGGTEPGTIGVGESQKSLAERVATLAEYAAERNVHLALEPLNPMFGGNRTCLFTVREALEICNKVGVANIGIAVDVYHVWWDTTLTDTLADAKGRVLGYHLCDWLENTSDMLLDRGMMGDGVADLRGIRQDVEDAGYSGVCEVEVFSSENWWKRDPSEVLDTIVERFKTVC